MDQALAQLDAVASNLTQNLLQALQENNDARAHALIDAIRAVKVCQATLQNLPQ